MAYLADMKAYIFILSFLLIGLKVQSQDSITVYYFLLEDCKICQYYTPLMNELNEKYNDDNLSFVGLFPNRYSNEETIAEFQEKYGIQFPLKREYFQTKTKDFGVKITPEVVIYNHATDAVLYKGRIDNAYAALGKRRRVVTAHELEDILVDLQEGKRDQYPNTDAVGCFISLVKD